MNYNGRLCKMKKNILIRDILKGEVVVLMFFVMIFSTVIVTGNLLDPPNKPSTPVGPTEGEVDEIYTYTTSTTDPEGDNIWYTWDWDDGTSDTVGAYPSGSTCYAGNFWSEPGTYCIRVQASDGLTQSDWSDELCVSITGEDNNAPEVPSKPSGPETGEPGIQYTYSTSTIDPDGHRVRYGWEWTLDDTVDGWTDLYNSDTPCSVNLVFDYPGTYYLRVKAEDEFGLQSDFSPSLTIVISEEEECPYFMGFQCCPLGEAMLEIGDELRVYNIGDSGDDGVEIDAAGLGKKKIRIDQKEEPDKKVGIIIKTRPVDEGERDKCIEMQQRKTNDRQYELKVKIPDAIRPPGIAKIIAVGPEDDIVFYREIEATPGWLSLGTFNSNQSSLSSLAPDRGPYGRTVSNLDDAGIVDIGWHTQDGKYVIWTCEELEIQAQRVKKLDVKIDKKEKAIMQKVHVTKTRPGEEKGELRITEISSGDIVPPSMPLIEGETSGETGVEYSYTLSNTGPGNVYLIVDWGDNSDLEWTDLISSGGEVVLSHSWIEEGNYTIKTKALDSDNAESDWATLEVSMPKNKNIEIFNPWLLRLIQRFPILEFLI
jgi:hypothetical protein